MEIVAIKQAMVAMCGSTYHAAFYVLYPAVRNFAKPLSKRSLLRNWLITPSLFVAQTAQLSAVPLGRTCSKDAAARRCTIFRPQCSPHAQQRAWLLALMGPDACSRVKSRESARKARLRGVGAYIRSLPIIYSKKATAQQLLPRYIWPSTSTCTALGHFEARLHISMHNWRSRIRCAYKIVAGTRRKVCKDFFFC